MSRFFLYLSYGFLAFLLLPLIVLIVGSVFVIDSFESSFGKFGFDNYRIAWDFLGSFRIFWDSIQFAFWSSLAATSFGVVIAWFYQRTDLRFRGIVASLCLLPMFVPGVIYTYAWILLASPDIGMLNGLSRLLSIETSLLNIYSFSGMVWVESLRSAPMVLLIVGAVLRSLDSRQEQAALLAGASNIQVFFRITLPLLLPTIGAAFLLLFIRAIGTFEVPAMLGGPIGIEVLSYGLYQSFLNYPLDTGPVAASAVPLLIIALVLVFIHERLVKGRSYQLSAAFSQASSARVSLGKSRTPVSTLMLVIVLCLTFLPLAAVVWSSLQPYFSQPSLEALSNLSLAAFRDVLQTPTILAASLNTLKFSAVAATLVVVGGIVFAWVLERVSTRGKLFIEPAIDMLLAIPGIVIGLAILLFNTRLNTGLYGTSVLMVLAFMTKYIPQGLRFLRSGLNQIPIPLEQAARCSGASEWQVLSRISLPLLAPAIISAWLYIAMLCAKDLSTALLLYTPGEEVLSVVLWQYWESGQVAELSALSVLLLVPVLAGVGLYKLVNIGRRMAHAKD